MIGVTIVVEIIAFAALPPTGATTLIGLYSLVLIWPSIVMYIKRAHDRNWPGAFILLMFVPLVNIWPLIELLFLRGTIGSNRFGADPVPRA